MSDRGFFAIDRGVWEHPLFAKEKYSEREAWIWLISSAAWEPTKVRIGRALFALERGQCVFSLRFLATRWMWSEARVRRFLNRLSADAAVLVKSTREASQITICNYNDYQGYRRTNVVSADAPLDEESTHSRRKEEELNKEERKKDTEAYASGAEAPLDPSEPERQFFKRGREVLGKSSGGQLAKLLKAAGGNVSLARSKIELAATKSGPAEFIAKVITTAGAGPPAKPLTQHQIERQESREILNDLQKFIDNSSGGGGDADFGVLRLDSGDRQESVYSGAGGAIIDLSPIGRSTRD